MRIQMVKIVLTGLIVSFSGSLSAHEGLPLGDGYLSSAPKKGSLFSCQQHFPPNAPGSHRTGEWVDGDRWYPDQKPTVDGAVRWPNARIDISVEGDRRVVRANNLPLHETGEFPVNRNDDAFQYDRNPNPIREQNILLNLPRVPQAAGTPNCVPMGMIGFMRSGAALFNALDARGRDAPAYEIQDNCKGHPERRGQYHYHDYSDCQEDTRSQPDGHSDVLGYALDGFGIFGLYGEEGNELFSQDLDECHGHTHQVTWDGEPREIYHYHFTRDYPYTVACYRGTPLEIERPRPPRGPRRPR